MSSFFVVLLVITLIVSFAIFHCHSTLNYSHRDGWIAILAFIGIIGWGFFGVVIPVENEKKPVMATVLHEPNAVHISANGNIRTYYDVKTYNYLSGKTNVEVLYVVPKTMYGLSGISHIELPLD